MSRTYIGFTGLVFALIFAAHLARVWAEGLGLLHDPFFILVTVAALGLAVWAVVLLSTRRA
jgi:Co/Zn/Cd efflux system component